jgi:hypothetical protein
MFLSVQHDLPRTLRAAHEGAAAARAHEGDFSCAGFDVERRSRRLQRLPLPQKYLNP